MFNQTVITISSRGANKVSVPVMPVRSGSFAVPYSKPLSQHSPAQLPEVLLSARLCHRHSHTPGFGKSLLELHPVHILSGSLGWHQGRVFPPLWSCQTRIEKRVRQRKTPGVCFLMKPCISPDWIGENAQNCNSSEILF